jgi:hypothetical protein
MCQKATYAAQQIAFYSITGTQVAGRRVQCGSNSVHVDHGAAETIHQIKSIAEVDQPTIYDVRWRSKPLREIGPLDSSVLFFPLHLNLDLHPEGIEQTKCRPKFQIASLSLEKAVKI